MGFLSSLTRILPPTHKPDGMPNLKGYIPELDGLRALAMILVLFVHWFEFQNPDGWIGRIILGGMRFGWVGVDLFFVISGFLITGILLETCNTPHYFKNFYIRRALRILPVYYLVLVIFLFIVPWTGLFLENYKNFWVSRSDVPIGPVEFNHRWWYFLFLSNFSESMGVTRHKFLLVTWSLCVEEHFYLLWPMVVYRYRQILSRVCIGLIAFSTGARIIMMHGFDSDPFIVGLSTPFRLDGLAMGSLMAIWARGGPEQLARLKTIARYALPIGFLGLLGANLLQELNNHNVWYDRGQYPTVVSFGKFFIDLFFAAVAYWVVFGRPDTIRCRVFRWEPLVRFGRLTYAVYLLHEPVQFFVVEIFKKNFGLTGDWSLMWLLVNAIAFVLVTLIAWISWIGFEGPILSLKKRFSYTSADGEKLLEQRPPSQSQA